LHWPLLSQHPFGHEVASQTQLVPLQRCPVAHVAHVAPALPQAELVSAVTQLFPLQQPLAHDVALQTHFPAEHACPLPQATQAAPPTPQLPVDDV
jgi:hypothetical protein